MVQRCTNRADGQHVSAGLYKPAAKPSQPHLGCHLKRRRHRVTAPAERKEQGWLGRAGSRLPSWRWLSILSSSTAPCFPPARPRALSSLYPMPQNLGRAEAEGRQDGDVRGSCSHSMGSSPERKSPSSQCPLQEEALFLKFWGLPGRQ